MSLLGPLLAQSPQMIEMLHVRFCIGHAERLKGGGS